MKITLTEWGARNYSPCPSAHILRTWARTGQIVPAPELVGRSCMVDERAQRIPLPMPANESIGTPSQCGENVVKLSSRAQHILNAA